MRDFFDRVVARAQGAEPTIQPRMSSRFERPDRRLVPADARGETEPSDGGASDEPRSRAATGGRAQEQTAGAPTASPSAVAAPPAAGSPDREDDRSIDAPAPTLAPGRPSAVATAEPASRRVPAPSSGATWETAGPERRDEADPSRPSERGSAPSRRVKVPPPEPVSSAVVRPAPGAPAPARRAWEVLQEIYSPSVDRGPAAEPPSHSTLALGDRHDDGRREVNAHTPPQNEGPREITIAIDRIDVRGLAPAPRPARTGRPGPRLTLSEYMGQHGRGKR